MGVQEDGRANRTVEAPPRAPAAVFEMAVGALATRGIRAPCKGQAWCFVAEVPGLRLLACLAAVLARDDPDRSPRVAQGYRDCRAIDFSGSVRANQLLELRNEALQQSGRAFSRTRDRPPVSRGWP